MRPRPHRTEALSAHGWLETACAAAQQEACERANERAGAGRDRWSRCSRAGWPDRLPGRALRNSRPTNEQPSTAEELLTQGHRADLTNVHQVMHDPHLDTLNVSQCSSERTPNVLLPTRPSVTQLSTPYTVGILQHLLNERKEGKKGRREEGRNTASVKALGMRMSALRPQCSLCTCPFCMLSHPPLCEPLYFSAISSILCLNLGFQTIGSPFSTIQSPLFSTTT